MSSRTLLGIGAYRSHEDRAFLVFRGTIVEADGGRFCVEALNSYLAESIPASVLALLVGTELPNWQACIQLELKSELVSLLRFRRLL